MVKVSFNSTNQNMALLRVRIIAKLVVIFIWLTVFVHRLIRSLESPESFRRLSSYLFDSLPFLIALSLIVMVEYCLYRKIGVQILKYSKYVDILFTLVYTGEWLFLMKLQLDSGRGDPVKLFTLYSTLSWANFGWRTLIPILISPLWQLRIIPHTAVSIYYLTFAVINQRDTTFFILFRGLSQVVYVILIYYLDHKIRLTMLIGNVQKDQWLQMNNFILNNIPENIAIMDSNGNCNFINENFKKLMELRDQSQNIKKFLGRIKQIKRIQQERKSDTDSDYVPVLEFRSCIFSIILLRLIPVNFLIV